jgi:hypothetical protein
MSDLDEHDGGETVFVEAWPGGLKEEDRIPMSTVRILTKKVLKNSQSQRFCPIITILGLSLDSSMQRQT